MFKDYDDYKEAIKYDDLVVFGSIKHLPLSEILRSDYDTDACPLTNQVFNPNKRVDWNNLKTIIHKLKEKVTTYSGIDKTKILTNIKLLEDSIELKENFYKWNSEYGITFDTLSSALNITIANHVINRNNLKEMWSYKKNQAFWAGAIEKRRPLVLCSPYHMYNQASNTTIHEMLWLHDNGYTFEPIMTGTASSDYINQIKIIAVPPSSQLEKGNEIKIIDYLKKSDQILELYNKNIITPLVEKIYSSNTTLKLSEVNKQYQDMYNEFVNKFNSYFNGIYPTEHQNLDMGTSEVLPLKTPTNKSGLLLSYFETQEAAKLFAQSSDTQQSDSSISVPPITSSLQSEAPLEPGKIPGTGADKDPSIESDNKSDTSPKVKRYKYGPT